MMNTYTATPAPTLTSFYDEQMNGLHIDGIFFALLCFASWIVFFSLWAWNHKPRRAQKVQKSEDWTMPHSNWRN